MLKPKGAEPMDNPTAAVAYARVSTAEQANGCDAQLAEIRRWADDNGVELAAVHVDRGVSGASHAADRPGLTLALADATARRCALVVAKRDRLARDPLVSMTVERALSSAGARVIALDCASDGDDPASVFMRRILDAAAELERGMIRARVAAGMAAAAAKGRHMGRAPFGWCIDADSGELRPDDAEQAVIQRIDAARAAGLSWRAVAAVLNAAGLRTRTGATWQNRSTQRVAERAAALAA